MTFKQQFLFVICLTVVILFYSVESKKILLEDIRTLTLRQGEWTTSRRSSPVPQLKCVGGTAGCYAFIPQHVQCYNRGSDGYDIQWECKTEMDTKYRFGKIDVSCEGYDYADDPYILPGSCGLEYTIDSLSNSKGSGYYSNNNYKNNPPTAFGGSAIGFIFVIMIIFFVYRTCFASVGASGNTFNSGSGTNFGSGNIPPRPPPYGFRPEYQQCGGDSAGGASFNSGYGQGQQQQPGFYSGMLAGGLLGYLFGNNRSSDYNNYYSRPRHSGWFGASSSPDYFSAGRDPSPSSSWGSTTRTTSGFGGTKRR